MNRERIKGIVIGFVISALLMTAVFASTSVMREVFYGVNLVINGQEWNPPDDMTPFISDGRTFLPVRGIAETLGVPVDWDGATRTVFVGTIPHGAPFWTTVPAFERTNTTAGWRFERLSTVNMLGNPYANAVYWSWGMGWGLGWSHHNLNAQFNALTATIGRVDGSGTQTSTISFIGDGREIASFAVDGDSIPRDISVDVTGVLILRIEMSVPTDGSTIALANAMIQ